MRSTALFVNMVWVCCFLLAEIYRYYPIVGHDFTYIVSHIFDTYLHYRINGLTIEWYTPSFGGGLPSYAHPQQMQFSLVQLLVFFVNPWDAVIISILIYMLAGLLCFYHFAKDVLHLDWRASLLGSLFFIVTGFYIGHMISGAFGFMAFPLLAGILLLLFKQGWSDWLAGIVLALLIVSLVYQAGFYLLVIFGLSCGITLPLLYLIDSNLFSFSSFFRRVSIAGLLSMLISASKLYAVYTFMRFFPREIPIPYSAQYTDSILPAALFFIAQLLGTTTLVPLMALAGWHVNLLPNILTSLSGYPISGLWETDNGISPALIMVFLLAGLMFLRSWRKIRLAKISKDKLTALFLLIFTVWFTIEYSLAKGWLYTLASQLPLLRSLHINFRFTSAFYFPLALLGSLILHRWFQAWNSKRADLLFLALNIITLVSPLSYFLYTDNVHYRMFDVRNILTAYQQSQHGETFPVKIVADKNTKDWDAITQGATTIKPYEPIFGYQLEAFAPQIHPGSVFTVTNGFFNMTNPASLTFPDENGGKLFSLFAESDRHRLDDFTQRKQPDWHIPQVQIVLDDVSALSFFSAVFIVLLTALRLSSWKLFKN
jgi:hypothetical protein